jgi:hypothetical protein
VLLLLVVLVLVVLLPIRKGRSRTVAETASAAHAAARGLSRRCGGGGDGRSGDRTSVAIARYASCWWMVVDQAL